MAIFCRSGHTHGLVVRTQVVATRSSGLAYVTIGFVSDRKRACAAASWRNLVKLSGLT